MRYINPLPLPFTFSFWTYILMLIIYLRNRHLALDRIHYLGCKIYSRIVQELYLDEDNFMEIGTCSYMTFEVANIINTTTSFGQ